ncbi:rhombosortase [Acinetobacter rudis]|uniref:Rhombosortase n=1 Tax=Acinetobacter rudis CIP 110305 TaxID=421052 RepID=S3NM21_9GAMM|nr:rhombosortase [Acinetobacter rudis]EPF80722.1 rhombosortase [Acinetobacter rudis CIP 110305]
MQEIELKKKSALIASSMLISASLQVFQPYFIYWRYDLWVEPWRIWTAHWVHVGWIHYLLNMLAFICLPFIFPRFKNRYLLSLILFLPMAISLSFYFIYPSIQAYAGFSGVLHGIYVAVALLYLQFAKERKFALLILALVLIKLVGENIFAPSQTAALIGSPVLTEAHVLGAVWGAVFAGMFMSWTWFKQRITHQNKTKL